MEILYPMNVKNPIRIWSLTINASDPLLDTLVDEQSLASIFKKICKSYVFAKELGEQKRFHYQCFLHLKEKTRTPVKLLSPYVDKEFMYLWQFSPAHDTNALKSYCAKNPVGEVCRFTQDYKPIALFEDIQLRPIQQQIVDLVEEHRSTRSIFVFSDSVGGIGKSTTIKFFLNKFPCVFAPSVGTPDSISQSIVRQLSEKNLDPTVKVIYLLFDITHTSNLMKDKNKKNNLASICESAVTGLLSCSFQGKTHSFYSRAGLVCPIIMTNFEPNVYKDLFSADRNNIYWLDIDKWRKA